MQVVHTTDRRDMAADEPWLLWQEAVLAQTRATPAIPELVRVYEFPRHFEMFQIRDLCVHMQTQRIAQIFSWDLFNKLDVSASLGNVLTWDNLLHIRETYQGAAHSTSKKRRRTGEELQPVVVINLARNRKAFLPTTTIAVFDIVHDFTERLRQQGLPVPKIIIFTVQRDHRTRFLHTPNDRFEHDLDSTPVLEHPAFQRRWHKETVTRPGFRAYDDLHQSMHRSF